MSKRKKLLILIMTCNLENYRFKEQIIRDTWFKDVSKYEDIVGCYFFTSSSLGNLKIDETEKIIYVPTQDYRDRTFNKFMETVFLIDNKLNVEYDYILRLNISTYPNLPLICDYIQTIDNEKSMFSGTICNAPGWIRPNGLLFTQGEFLLFSKWNLLRLKEYYSYNKVHFDNINNDPDYSNKYYNDDGWVTHILYAYYKNTEQKNIYDYFKNVHTLGLIHEYDKECKRLPEEYKTVLCISYKVCAYNNNEDLVKNTGDLESDLDGYTKNKLLNIHKIITDFNKDKTYIPVSIDYINKMIDTQCYTADMVIQNWRLYDKQAITKDECIKNFEDINKDLVLKYKDPYKI